MTNPLYEAIHFSLLGTFRIFSFFFFLTFLWPRHAARGILVPQPGLEPTPPAVEAWSLNHWTTREVPQDLFLIPGILEIYQWSAPGRVSFIHCDGHFLGPLVWTHVLHAWKMVTNYLFTIACPLSFSF